MSGYQAGPAQTYASSVVLTSEGEYGHYRADDYTLPDSSRSASDTWEDIRQIGETAFGIYEDTRRAASAPPPRGTYYGTQPGWLGGGRAVSFLPSSGNGAGNGQNGAANGVLDMQTLAILGLGAIAIYVLWSRR